MRPLRSSRRGYQDQLEAMSLWTARTARCRRPSEKTTRRMRYSGKKKTFTNNINVYTNTGGVIIGISKSSVGSTGDITLLREDPMPFGKWTESMRDEATPKEDRIRIWADRGYQGTGKDLPGATLMIPYKRSKKHRILTAEQKVHNHLVNSTRVRVEHSIGRIKRYACLADPYDGTIGQFNHEFNVITGLVNLHLLWDKIDKSPPSPDRWGMLIDWNGIVPLQKAPRSEDKIRAQYSAARVRTNLHTLPQKASCPTPSQIIMCMIKPDVACMVV